MSNAEDTSSRVFDKGTKIYTGILLLVVLAFAGHWLYTWVGQMNSPLGKLNAKLAADPELAAYPYPFRVMRIDGDTAVMTSPRSADFSVLRFLDIVHPELKGGDPNSAPLIAAQKELAHAQKRAKKTVLAEPGIKHIKWELDKPWLRRHGIEFYD